ncbi:MAG: hypothetical protein ABIJ57_14775 [Pseudomonadota bacterium]
MRYLPTVTETIAPWVDFSRIPLATLQAAADRGTAVHAACANIARALPVIGVSVECAGYVASFVGWFDKIVEEALLVEERLFDEANGYCGQIDLLVSTKGGELWLVDLKSPVILSKSWKVQIAAYGRLCDLWSVKNNVNIDRCGSLRLRKDGGIPSMDWYEGSALQDFNIFLSALNCFRFFKG